MVWCDISVHFQPPRSGKVQVNWSPAVLRRQPTHIFSGQMQANIYEDKYCQILKENILHSGNIFSKKYCQKYWVKYFIKNQKQWNITNNIEWNILPGGRPAWPPGAGQAWPHHLLSKPACKICIFDSYLFYIYFFSLHIICFYILSSFLYFLCSIILIFILPPPL